ncbi:MAG: ABC transporter ATP-binding protein [Candidatus Heimdallarchaeota archaeon]|nr:ABC transporter ATP-binding protein [Candidatus Heimdallarchaeota archaeon]MBY8993293.1 ABC transporter ATP-binding protein [Candidatus Heimdallarchaeota archaeon]
MTVTEKSDTQTFDENNAIEVKNLKKHFKGKRGMEDVKAVDGISFHVEKGEFFGLLGTNGAGKTTTINVLTGILLPTEGTAFVDGHNVETEMKKIKEKISVCPQEPALYKFLTGLGNIKFFGNMYMLPKEQIIERAEELLNLLGLYEARNRFTRGYSGGMKRQLSLIISLINKPEILFLDEPTVGLDPRNRRKVWDFLRSQKEQKNTIILTTHYIEEAEALCDRVAIMDYGEIVAMGSPQELIKEHQVENLEKVFLKITGRSILEGI